LEKRKSLAPIGIQMPDRPARSLVPIHHTILELLNLYMPNENLMHTKYTAKMNNTDTRILTLQASRMLATAIMKENYKIFHPIVLHIATTTDSQNITT
jgi:hypothetical protein